MTDLFGAALCKYNLKDAANKCNEVKYTSGMSVDSSSGLVKCGYAQDQKCNYTNTDKTTYSTDCSCALNADGDAFCAASPGDSKS